MGGIWFFLALFAAPVVYVVWSAGTDGILNLFCADAYYYLTIAQRSSSIFNFTFDGALATNGFHPLWQILVWVLLKSFNGLEQQVWALFILNILVASLAVYLLLRSLYKKTRNPLSLFFIVPGAFTLIAPYYHMYSIEVWRLINGLETSLELFFWALLLLFFQKHFDEGRAEDQGPGTDLRLGLWLGVLGACLVFSRLENLVLVFTLPLILVGKNSTGLRWGWP